MSNEDSTAGFFMGGWYVFDNFAPFQFEYDGVLYSTLEHAYQSLKFLATNPELAEKIRLLCSPAEVFEYTRETIVKEQVDPGWDDKKIEIMEMLSRSKLEQHPIIKRALVATGHKTIVEMNDADDFWGWGEDHKGRNELGKVWMRLREEILHE